MWIKVSAKDSVACHRVGKQGRAIVKFLKRNDCHQVLSVKKDIQKITATDLELPNANIKLYLNESLRHNYSILWSRSKALFTMVKIHSYFISNGSDKISLQEQGPSIPVTHTADFEKCFPGVDFYLFFLLYYFLYLELTCI